MAISRSAFEQARKNPGHMQCLIEYSAMEAGQRRIDRWLTEVKLYGAVNIAVVGIWNDYTNMQLDAWAKVVVPGVGSFEHQEMYSQFPSDHFKTKVLLATGGT